MNRLPALVGTAAVLALTCTPAMAAPYPVPNAKTEIQAAVDATNAAPSYQYRRNDLGWTSAYNSAGQYQ